MGGFCSVLDFFLEVVSKKNLMVFYMPGGGCPFPFWDICLEGCGGWLVIVSGSTDSGLLRNKISCYFCA